MTYLLFQAGLLLALAAAHCADEALRRLGSRPWLREPLLQPGVAALIAAVGPGVAHLLQGRWVTGAYVPSAMFALLALLPAPFPLLGVPGTLIFGPLWAASILDALVAARRGSRHAAVRS